MNKLTLIVARNLNGTIGIGPSIPWKLPDDLRHFKEATLGGVLIVGRKTYETLPPLEGRTIVVVSKTPSRRHNWVTNKEDALKVALELANDKSKIFVAGGAEIYKLFLDDVTDFLITTVHNEVNGDVKFDVELPRLDIKRSVTHTTDPWHRYSFTITHGVRKQEDK